MTTCIYAHSNRIDAGLAFERGGEFYRSMIETSPQAPNVRFVIWSWPSTKVFGILRDVRTKASRCDTDAYYLAQFLSRFDDQARVSLIGYSFGARIISGAMHLLDGGSLTGNQLSRPRGSTAKKFRVVMMAPAMHNDWLDSEEFHGRTVNQIDRMLLLYNSCDPLLKRYRKISRCQRPEALGYTGLYNLEDLGDVQHRLQQEDVGSILGRTHAPLAYIHSPWVMKNAGRYALWENVDP